MRNEMICGSRNRATSLFNKVLLKGIFMSRRSTFVKLATKAGILFGALFLVTVLIAAIPAHQQRALEVVVAPEQQDSAAQSQTSDSSADHSSMPGMNMEEK